MVFVALSQHFVCRRYVIPSCIFIKNVALTASVLSVSLLVITILLFSTNTQKYLIYLIKDIEQNEMANDNLAISIISGKLAN